MAVSHVIHGKGGSNLIPQCFVASMMLVSLIDGNTCLIELPACTEEGRVSRNISNI